MIGKAKERPQQAKQVIDVLKTQGPVQTYRAVMKKLDAYSPLGYSCAGEVLEVGSGVSGFQKGDFVACGGLSACHAEVVAVPKNLCVKLDPEADLKQAAYNTLGAIALQAVRQADLKLGETCCVIGLGLLGQLSCLLLRAAGVRTVGVDVKPAMVDMAAANCADLALARGESGIVDTIQRFAGGLGCDGVIIAAATDSLDPINFAGAISRKRGTVVVLGDVPTGFDRDPHYYRKELQVRMSCSYGPGRYDPEYEDKGHDYPPAYVRWTEQRNMQAFQELIGSGRIDVSYLTTHVFKLEEAPKAYDLILERQEPSVGILIEYDATKDHLTAPRRVELKQAGPAARVSIGFIGAGSYAQSHLLPNIPKESDIILKGVATATSASARSSGERYGFEFCTTDPGEILDNPDINTVFIASRHDSHARYVKAALAQSKHVFVEKPLCLTSEELEEISQVYREIAAGPGAPQLMVGYNRRFSPFMEKIKRLVTPGPVAAHYRVNAGAVPRDSWVQDPEIGGGRIIGEACHFVDILVHLCNSLPQSVHAVSMPDPQHLLDTVMMTLEFGNGSIGTVSYLANGDSSLPKERLEVFAHGCAAVLDDYKGLSLHVKGRARRVKKLSQDKGQKNEIARFVQAVKTGGEPVIPFDQLHAVSWATFAALESIRTRSAIRFPKTNGE